MAKAAKRSKGAKRTRKAKKARPQAPTKKKRAAVKKRAAKPKQPVELTASLHLRALTQLIANAHTFQKSPLCYKEYPDGSAQVCKLLPDGTYGDCEPYLLKPVPGPRCG